MKLRTPIFILCLLCVTFASKILSKEINESKEVSLADLEDLSENPMQKNNEADKRPMEKFRDKRALGLLLSGLAQIFGYTVTPIQLASLPNPTVNTSMPAAMPMGNSGMTGNIMMGQQAASSQPMSTNATAPTPRQEETIRFTGVLNIGNNSDIVGHLQRYEQIFHGRGNNTATMAMTTLQSPTMPMSATNFSLDLRTNKGPLLAPFFVKIPLPLAPNLPPAIIPIEDFKVSYPKISIMNEPNEDVKPPIRKEQETLYTKNEDTEQYTVEEKDIYDEKDVKKPITKYSHQLYVDEPNWEKEQDDKYNELRRKQEEHIARMKEQEKERYHNKGSYNREDEISEKPRDREEEIVNRNQQYTSKYEPMEERRPVYNEEDEDSAERYEEREKDQANFSNESSKQPLEKNEREESSRSPPTSKSYPNYDDDESGQQRFNDNQPDRPLPADFDKYIEKGYNQQLPIGDYFHDGNSQEIRDSYGEILNNKNPEDDRLSDYFSMFKHPYTDAYNYPKVHDTEDASRENAKEEAPATNIYDEHLNRIQKLREEYALPENKYEEYDIGKENEEDRNDEEESERIQNRTEARPEKFKSERIHDEEDTGARTTNGSDRNQLQHDDDDDDDDRSDNVKSQEETGYMPLVVPVRYIDARDKIQQATMQQLKYKESDKSGSNPVAGNDANVAPTVSKKKLTSQLAGLPEIPRQLHEGEHRKFQVWPPPFDFAFDNTERTNTIIPTNTQDYPLNHYQNVVPNEANNDNSSEQPAGYVVVVGNPYGYPHNIYYFPNEATNSENRDPHLNAKGTHSQYQHYVPQQYPNQQPIQTSSNLAHYNRNETTIGPQDYYQSQIVPATALDSYRYVFGERTAQASEPNIDVSRQISNMENWSSRIPQSQDDAVSRSLPGVAQERNVVFSNQNAHRRPLERQRNSRSSRRRKNSRAEDHLKAKASSMIASSQQSKPKKKSFHDPQSAHDFFGFSKNDYSLDGESADTSKVGEENGNTAKESAVFVAPEPTTYNYDESVAKHADEPENDTEKAKVREYRNRVATLRVSEQRRMSPNGPIHYVNYEKREEMQRRNELENRMAEILENLKTRLLVE